MGVLEDPVAIETIRAGEKKAETLKLDTYKTSVFIELIKKLLTKCAEKSLGNLNEAVELLLDYLPNKAVFQPPNSCDVFDENEVVEISDFLLYNVLIFWKMYKYSFCNEVTLEPEFVYDEFIETTETEKEKETVQLNGCEILKSLLQDDVSALQLPQKPPSRPQSRTRRGSANPKASRGASSKKRS